MSRKKFNFSQKTIEDIIALIVKNGIELSGISTEEKPTDPKDVIFYEVTMASRQTDETFLVTGNIKDFPLKPFVVTPAEMKLELIKKMPKKQLFDFQTDLRGLLKIIMMEI